MTTLRNRFQIMKTIETIIKFNNNNIQNFAMFYE